MGSLGKAYLMLIEFWTEQMSLANKDTSTVTAKIAWELQ